MNQIAALLSLQKTSRDAEKIEDLGFIITNQTQRVIPLKQIIFWTVDHDYIDLTSISGGKKIDNNGPYALALKDFLKNKIKKITDTSIITINAQNHKDAPDILLTHHHYLLPLYTTKDGVIGGLWIDHDKALPDGAEDLLNDLGEHYAQCLLLLQRQQSKSSSSWSLKSSKTRLWIGLACIALFCFPIRLSITAPAEIVPERPAVVTAPFDGIIEDINVKPGDSVTVDDVIVMMDRVTLQAQFDNAQQALKTAQSALSRTGLESLRTEEKKVDLQKLRGDIETKRIELDHTRALLKKSDIMAPTSGVAIFSDTSSLKGKPIRAGEKIMVIADPAEKQLLIRVPAQNILPLQDQQDVSFFVNTAPLTSISAIVTTIGYQASQDPDGLLTYKIRATFEGDDELRIGWKGTAKMKTEWSILGYAILRRPLIALRNLMGV